MLFLRNPEVHLTLWFGVPISAVLLFVLNRLSDGKTSILVVTAVALVLILTAFLIIQYRHAKRIRKFSESVLKSLSAHRNLPFEDYTEGDLAVLQNITGKMLFQHFRQEENLKKEKQLLKLMLENISHQLKTPLQNMTLSVDMMMKKGDDELHREILLSEIMNTTTRINNLVQMLMDYSRMEAGVVHLNKEPIPADELIDVSCRDLLIPMELFDVTLETNIQDGAVAYGDRKWLPQALSNIIKNCMEHSPGGTIRIDVSDDVVSTQIVIRDNGIGIDPDDLPHIFERFHSGKNSGSNSAGIGLSLTKWVIDELDGNIDADNNDDCGAIFKIDLYKKIV